MEPDDRTIENSPVVLDILAYLVEHPEAQDTLEGVMKWWLLEREIKRETAKIKTALDQLVAKGLVLERQGEGSRPRYGLNQRKMKQIQALVESNSE